MGHRRRHCGIYLITHLPSGKLYVGKSLDVFMRWNSHCNQLFMKTHHNKFLQALFDAGNYREFSFTILKLCKKTEVTALEKQYINEYNTSCPEKLLNISGRKRKNESLPVQNHQS
jgi:group I intron endonuclease